MKTTECVVTAGDGKKKKKSRAQGVVGGADSFWVLFLCLFNVCVYMDKKKGTHFRSWSHDPGHRLSWDHGFLIVIFYKYNSKVVSILQSKTIKYVNLNVCLYFWMLRCFLGPPSSVNLMYHSILSKKVKLYHHRVVDDHCRLGSNHHRVVGDHHRTGGYHHRVEVDYHWTCVDHDRVVRDHHRTCGDHYRMHYYRHRMEVYHHRVCCNHHRVSELLVFTTKGSCMPVTGYLNAT